MNINLITILEISFGVSIGIIISIIFIEITIFITDKVNKKDTHSELHNCCEVFTKDDLSKEIISNYDYDDVYVDKAKFSKAELKILENGYVSEDVIIGCLYACDELKDNVNNDIHFKYIRYYNKIDNGEQFVFKYSSLNFMKKIEFCRWTKRVTAPDIGVKLMESLVERCKELGWY